MFFAAERQAFTVRVPNAQIHINCLELLEIPLRLIPFDLGLSV